jgi:predicted glycosyltransferase
MFRNLAKELGERGHDVRFTLREKECARDLLDQYALPYEVLSQRGTGLGLLGEFLQRGARLWRVTSDFRPHFLAGVMGPSIATVGRLRRALRLDRARVAVFYGTEIAKLTNSVVYPLADYVCTPDSYQGHVSGNHITYPGYHELSYLHPNRFRPDREIVKQAGIDADRPYFVVRFVSYQASHDTGADTLPAAKKLALVRMLAERGRVLVSSEGELPRELEPFKLRIPVSHIHHVLAFARMVAGESSTMASEAAVLGVPGVYISPFGRGFTDDQERYGLVQNFTGPKLHADWVAAVRTALDDPTFYDRVRAGHARMLAEKVDVTSWMLGFFERELATHFGERL